MFEPHNCVQARLKEPLHLAPVRDFQNPALAQPGNMPADRFPPHAKALRKPTLPRERVTSLRPCPALPLLIQEAQEPKNPHVNAIALNQRCLTREIAHRRTPCE